MNHLVLSPEDDDEIEKFFSAHTEFTPNEPNFENKDQRLDEETCNSVGYTSTFKPNQRLIKAMESVDRGILPIAIKLPKGVFTQANEKRTKDQERLMWDKRIIDLYHLYLRHRRTFHCENSAGFRNLFSGITFDLEMANQLVTSKGTSKAVLNYLGLDNRQEIQLELCAYRSTQVVRHHKNSFSKEHISAMVHQNNPRASLDDAEQHYLAYMALRLAQGSLVKAVEYSQYLGSEPLSRDQLKRKKNKFEKWFLSLPGKKAKNYWQII